jgi:hypothetical protein
MKPLCNSQKRVVNRCDSTAILEDKPLWTCNEESNTLAIYVPLLQIHNSTVSLPYCCVETENVFGNQQDFLLYENHQSFNTSSFITSDQRISHYSGNEFANVHTRINSATSSLSTVGPSLEYIITSSYSDIPSMPSQEYTVTSSDSDIPSLLSQDYIVTSSSTDISSKSSRDTLNTF